MDIIFNSSDIITLIGNSVSSVIGLLGVLVGAHIANASSKKQQKLDTLRSAYSLVFERYTEWVPRQSTENASALAGAICSAMLLANPETRSSLDTFLAVIIKPKPDSSACKKCFDDFWKFAEKEIRKGYGK